MISPPEKKAAWNVRLLHRLWDLGFLPEKPKNTASPAAAAKSNIHFALSGLCWLFLYFRSGTTGMLTWYAMVLAMVLLAQLVPSIHRGIRLPLCGKLLAGFSALGTVGAGVRVSMGYLASAGGTEQIADFLGLSVNLAAAGFSSLFGLCGLWFLYVLIGRMYTALVPVLRRLFADTHRWERLGLVVLTAALAVYTAMAFAASEAFYATEYNYDVIYTADSPYLVMGNTWLNLTFAENDLRQPLFAVFAAPFVGGAYALSQLLPNGSWLGPWLMNLPQLGLMVLSYTMLSALLASTGCGRLAVAVGLCALYPTLLFSLMMEQYLVAVFWLLLFVYMVVEELPGRGAVLVAASGSLLTSAALLPALWQKDKPRPVRCALLQSLTAALMGAFLIVLFLRLDVVLNLTATMEQLSSFAGESISLSEKLRQYLIFVAGCFTAPPAGETLGLGFPSWQLLPANGIHPGGCLVLLLCLGGAVLGRRERLVQISAGWCLFSLLLLVGFGWGTAENGLILYALYFGWAFYVLLRQCVAMPLKRLGLCRWQPAVDAAGAVLLLGLNWSGISRLLDFAVSCYPV